MNAKQIRDVYIVASASQIDRLDAMIDGHLSSLMRIAVEPDEDLPIEGLHQARALIVEVDPDMPNSLQRLAALHRELPHLPVAAAIRNAEVGTMRLLMRHGIADVLELPFDVAELADRIADLLAIGAPASESVAKACPLICVAGANGGAGATTVLTHLASIMGEELGGASRVCLVDLALQSGDVSSYLGLEPNSNILDLLDAGDRLDTEVIRTTMQDSGRGFSVLAAPQEMVPMEQVDARQLLNLLGLLRQEFSAVLVDLPPSWLDWSLSTAVSASRILLLTEQRVGALRNAKRTLDMLDSLDIDRSRVEIVLNRVEKRLFQPIATHDVEETLNRPVVATLANDADEIDSAQTQGLLVFETARKSRFAKDVAALAETLLSGDRA